MIFKFNINFKQIGYNFSILFKCLKLIYSKIIILTLKNTRTTLAEYGSTEEIFSIVKEIVKTTDSQIQVI